MNDIDLTNSELIDLVKKFAILYNKNDLNYNNKTAKQNAWASIGAIMDAKPEDCEQRWTLLRTRYSKEVVRLERLEGTFNNKPIWHLMGQLSFLDRHILRRNRGRSLEKKRNSFTEVRSMYEQKSANIQIKSDLYAEDVSEGASSCTSSHKSEPSIQTNAKRKANNVPDEINKVSKISETGDESVGAAVNALCDYLKRKDAETEENEDACFSKFIYHKLKNIENIKRKNKIKMDMMQLFLDEDD